MNKKVTRFIVFVLFAFLVVSCSKSNKKSNLIRIGAILPLTGYLSNLGQDEKIGIELALAEINKKQEKIKVIYEDGQANGKNSLTAVKKLLNQDVNKFIISTTPTVMSVLESYKENKSLFFVSQFMTSGVIEKYNNAIRVYPHVNQETDLFAEYIKAMNIKKIALFYVDNDYGKNAIQSLKSKLNAEEIHFYEETFDLKNKDYKNQFYKITEYHPDAVLIYSYPDQWPAIAKQMEEAKIDKLILANTGYCLSYSDEYKKLSFSNRIVFSAPYYFYSKESEKIRNFSDLLQKKYKKEINFDIAYFYDAMMILYENYQLLNESSEVIKENILKKEYYGITGSIKFVNNDIVSELKLLKNAENGFVVIK